MRAIFNELNEAATNHPAIQFIFPIHPNPNVQKFRTLLKGDNLRVIEPVGYPEMLRYISDAGFIISDSGGLQEEAVYFGKKILIVRKNTERPETVESGLGKLVGLDIVENIGWALKPSDPPENNPFGEGDSCRKISEIITTELY
jgi:UDP-N-acetylglucosamine 2-epimerase